MYTSSGHAVEIVHCRTGSLENRGLQVSLLQTVHCRTGSLETTLEEREAFIEVHCRTGSLEKPSKPLIIF